MPQSGALPATGSGTGLLMPTDSLHDQVAGALAPRLAPGGGSALPARSTAPAWLITPAITVQQEWTDNAAPGTASGTRPRASLITVVTPALSVSGESARLSGNLNYAPVISYYYSVPSQNQVAQNLDATGHVTVLAEQLFVDLRGFAAQQSLNGATAPAGTAPLSRQNQVQSYSFSATPYLTHRFGGWGTAQLGASVGETTQTALSGSLPGSTGNTQTLQSRQEFASFVSGENFGRTSHSVQLAATQESGTGPLAGAYRDTAAYQAGYAISHSITALAGIGWENIAYAGAGALHIDDATWNVGTRLAPNPDSIITLLYGHQEGATAASLDASYAPTPRTRLFARYSESVSTAAEQLQNSLSNAQLDPLGNPVDATTGAPLQLTNNFFGATGVVYRVRSASLTAAWQLDRDSWQATLNRQQRTPLGAPTPGSAAASADRGTYGSLAWQHDLSAALKSSLFVQYGIDDAGSGAAQGSSRLTVVSASLTYAVSPTLSATAQYSYTSTSSDGPLPSQTTNLAAVGLRKTF